MTLPSAASSPLSLDGSASRTTRRRTVRRRTNFWRASPTKGCAGVTASGRTRHEAQLREELSIIAEVGYEEYFLAVWDILQECQRRGIAWITRGSAADSLVCYSLGISGVCPIRFELYFRRFLNRERMALNKLPDIDIDFAHDRKDDVVDLIFERYGPRHAAIVGGLQHLSGPFGHRGHRQGARRFRVPDSAADRTRSAIKRRPCRRRRGQHAGMPRQPVAGRTVSHRACKWPRSSTASRGIQKCTHAAWCYRAIRSPR